jgi:soluble lytic murein transglycosylase-like protein
MVAGMTVPGVKRILLGCAFSAFLGSLAQASTTTLAAAPSQSFAAAQRYENGEGVARDLKRAHDLYCDAADQGDARAYFNLGWMYANGRGVERNGAIAVGWWRKAADHGVPAAANVLRLMKSTAPASDLGCEPSEPPPGIWPAQPSAEVRRLVHTAASSAGLDSLLVMSVIAAESAFDPRAVSPKNAKGLMQLMPETAARFGVQDPFNPEQNIRGGTTYLRWLLERFSGDVTLALAAYNAGEAKVDFYGGVPPYPETKSYIARIKRTYNRATVALR